MPKFTLKNATLTRGFSRAFGHMSKQRPEEGFEGGLSADASAGRFFYDAYCTPGGARDLSTYVYFDEAGSQMDAKGYPFRAPTCLRLSTQPYKGDAAFSELISGLLTYNDPKAEAVGFVGFPVGKLARCLLWRPSRPYTVEERHAIMVGVGFNILRDRLSDAQLVDFEYRSGIWQPTHDSLPRLESYEFDIKEKAA